MTQFGYQKVYATCPNITASFSTSVTEICGAGSTAISFINLSSGTNARSAGYQWFLNGVLFGNTTDTLLSPTSTISAVGVYNYMLVAYDTLGVCADTFYRTVTITPLPVANFSFPTGSICPNTSVNFTNSSTNLIAGSTFSWQFGDGGSDTAKNPSHIYGGGGTYTVSLTVYNSALCSSVVTNPITILNVPTLNILGDDGDGDVINCVSPVDTITQELVTFINRSDSGVTYTWNFGDGTPSVTQRYSSSPDTITHLFTSFGTFPVVCSAIAPNGCLYTDTIFVIFDKYISASFSVPLNQISGCAPHTVQPINASVNATRFRWDFGDGSPIITTTSYAAPSHTYDSTGIYTITLVASNDCNSSRSTVGPIVVSEAPMVDFTHSLIGRGCSPQIITFTNTSQLVSPLNNYKWDMGNGNVYTGVPPPAQTYSTGTYFVKLIASNGCGTDSVIRPLFIDSLPYATVSISPTKGCSRLTINGNAVKYGYGTLSRWYVDSSHVAFGDSLPSQIFVNTTDSIQTHTIRYNVTNHCGSFDSTVIVEVHPEVKAILNPTTNPICYGDSLLHQSLSTGDSLTYSWFFGGGTTSSLVGPHWKTYNKTGLDSVKLVVTGYCGTDSVTKIVVIDSLPYASIVVTPLDGCSPMLVSGSSVPMGGNTTSTWYRNGISYFTGDTMPSTTFINNSTSIVNNTIRYNITNHCGRFDTTITIKVHPAVQARLTPSNPSICVGDTLLFRNNSNGDSLTFLWKFGNGDTSTLSGPHSKRFSSAGNDTTWLIASGYCGIDSVSTIVNTKPNPVAAIIADKYNGCEDLRVNFTNGAANTASYAWLFSGGFPFLSTSYNPSVLYTTPGLKQVYLTVDSLGCISRDTTTIDVYPGPAPSFTRTPISGCSDLLVSITNTSPVSPGDRYSWSLGNGNTDTVYSPSSQTYTNSSFVSDSTYGIKLVIYTSNGCNDSVTNPVTVHPNPNSSFVISNSVICEKEITNFNNTSVGATSYKWLFGDGDSSLLTNPTHSYDTAGSYTVRLITTTAWNCSDTSLQTIVVNPSPVAVFHFDTACLTYRSNFVDSSLFNPITWKWYFGDGDSSSLQNPSHLYAKNSVYPVVFKVTNSFGCSDSASNQVIVYNQPTAGFSLSTACAKASTQFTDTSLGSPLKWKWFFGDGDSSFLQNPSHIYAVGGNFSVMLIVENIAGCADTLIQTVTISTVPQTYFVADSVCVGNPTHFIDSTVLNYPSLSYSWNFGDGNSSSLTNPIYQYLNPGTYFVSLTVTNVNGCDSTFSDSVVVYSMPTANFNFDTVCEGLGTSFNNTSSGGYTNTFWDFGDGSPTDTNNLSLFTKTYLTDGAFLVKQTVINTGGCRDSLFKTVIVHPNTVANFTPQVDSVCLLDSITFLNSSVGGTVFFWDFGDGNTSSLINPSHVYLTSGIFSVRLISTSPFNCSDTLVDTVTVLANPLADFNVDTVCFNLPNTFINSSIGGSLSWSWNFGDGNTDTAKNTTHLYGIDSSFMVVLRVSTPFGCSDTASKIAVVLPDVSANFNSSLACVNRPISFNDSSQGNPVSWNWDFGDGGISSSQNPTHTYSSSGSFSVRLIISNAQGCSDTLTNSIFVNTVPVPNFTADSVCFGNITNFRNLSTNSQPITTYYWDFGDGNSSFSTNPSYVYSSPGTYSVTLTVTNNGGCDSSITKLVVVRTAPVADFIHDTVCVGLPTSFVDTSSGSPTSWKWNFGDFSPIDSTSGPIVTHRYSTAGQFTASLIVQSGTNGCTSQSIKFVTVLGGVNASFSVGTPICDGTRVQFVNNSTASSGGIVSTSWSFGDGNSSSLNNPTHLYGSAGVYRVTLNTISSFGCTGVDSVNVVVNSNPVANFGYTPNICIGNPTPFFDSSSIPIGTIKNWNWSFGDGNTDSLQNPANTYTSAGNFLVTLQVTSDSGCTNNTSKIIRINPKAFVNFTYTPVCVGDTIKFKDLSTIAPPDSLVNWFWEFGDGSVSSSRNPSHVYSGNTQSYLVKLTITSGLSCVSDTTILVSHLPVPNFNYGPQFYGYCENQLVQFYDSSTIAPPSSIVGWEWTYGNGHNSFMQNPSHVFDSAGSYLIQLKMTTSDGCIFYDSLLAPLIIYPNPVANFLTVPSVVSVFRPEVYFDNKAIGAVNYVWDFGDGSSGTVAYPTHLYPNVVGHYTATQYAYSSFGCVDSISKTIYVKDEFTLYVPNAFTPEKNINNTFQVKGYQLANFNLKIFNRWGELIFESIDANNGWDGTYNGENCPMDAYVYQVSAQDLQGNNYSKRGHVNLIR